MEEGQAAKKTRGGLEKEEMVEEIRGGGWN